MDVVVQQVNSALMMYAALCRLVQTESCRQQCVELAIFVRKVWNVTMVVAVRCQCVHPVLNLLDDAKGILVPLGRYLSFTIDGIMKVQSMESTRKS